MLRNYHILKGMTHMSNRNHEESIYDALVNENFDRKEESGGNDVYGSDVDASDIIESRN